MGFWKIPCLLFKAVFFKFLCNFLQNLSCFYVFPRYNSFCFFNYFLNCSFKFFVTCFYYWKNHLDVGRCLFFQGSMFFFNPITCNLCSLLSIDYIRKNKLSSSKLTFIYRNKWERLLRRLQETGFKKNMLHWKNRHLPTSKWLFQQ